MAKSKTTGLIKRGGIWHIDKRVDGIRICESTETSDYAQAERYLAERIAGVRRERAEALNRPRTFLEAATRYLEESTHKAVAEDARTLKIVAPYIGKLGLYQVHAGSLQPFIKARQEAGIAAGTINRDLAIIKRVLTLSARLWRDDQGQPWLPTIPMLPTVNGPQRKPYPLSWEEQAKLFAELPSHLADMALFAVHTGCRDSESCELRWNEEIRLEDGSVFLLEGERTKNGKERIIVLNRAAQSVVDAQRGHHPEFVFSFRGHPVTRMNNSAWKNARQRANLPSVRVHDLRHTFGRRLRAAGVSLEDRQDLLGHHAGRITTHYSAAEIGKLREAVDSLLEADSRTGSRTTILRLARNG
jgi:integrase